MSALTDPNVFALALLWAMYAFLGACLIALVVYVVRTPARKAAERKARADADRAYAAHREYRQRVDQIRECEAVYSECLRRNDRTNARLMRSRVHSLRLDAEGL